jgi:hypothetical protein
MESAPTAADPKLTPTSGTRHSGSGWDAVDAADEAEHSRGHLGGELPADCVCRFDPQLRLPVGQQRGGPVERVPETVHTALDLLLRR